MGQGGWFACVLSAARGQSWIGVTLCAVLVMAHIFFARKPPPELKFILVVTIIGAIWESVLVWAGLLSYSGGALAQDLAPYWIAALWALFAAQFNTTYNWLKPRIGVAALLGAFAGPLSFRAGATLGAVRFEKPWPATLALAIGWACLLPTLVLLSRRWDGVGLLDSQRWVKAPR